MEISSVSTAFYKRLVPRLVYGGLAVVSAMAMAGAAIQRDPWLLGFPVVAFTAAIALVRLRLRPLADRVDDCGDHLLVRRDGLEARVALASIARVGMIPRGTIVVIALTEASPFGREVTFVARQDLASTLVAELRQRSAPVTPRVR